MPEPLTYDRLRADIAELLYLEPGELAATDDLFDAGLDSVRLVGLVERWKTRGAAVSFADLAERPTLDGWWALLAPDRGR
ncbi:MULTISPECIES: phosphopantetheine-binding protein [unclassified Nocardia]|uniref:phosphopantetheine-binding protein n=1 Tax=unclassified Nocardia TaxID=2637762 RepID=UPI001CE4043F|nr:MULTISPECIES: phosphopantetheine-binding protein [unclassified Nocardia]